MKPHKAIININFSVFPVEVTGEASGQLLSTQELRNANVRPFTVVFVKQNGEKRVMRAKFISTEPLLGRSIVSDLDDEFKIKQVDHRTIESIIIDKVKYVHK